MVLFMSAVGKVTNNCDQERKEIDQKNTENPLLNFFLNEKHIRMINIISKR
jgi:NAD(P)H-flavin reductase